MVNEKKFQKIEKEELLNAIENGVKKAIHEMMDSGDGFNGPIIRDYVIEKIGEKLENALFSAMPDLSYLKERIGESVHLAFKNHLELQSYEKKSVSRK